MLGKHWLVGAGSSNMRHKYGKEGFAWFFRVLGRHWLVGAGSSNVRHKVKGKSLLWFLGAGRSLVGKGWFFEQRQKYSKEGFSCFFSIG